MKLETERLTLRPTKARATCRSSSSSTVTPTSCATSEAASRRRRKRCASDVVRNIRRFELDGRGLLVVELREAATLIGEVDLLPWDPEEQQPGTVTELGDRAEMELRSTSSRATGAAATQRRPRARSRDFAFAELAHRAADLADRARQRGLYPRRREDRSALRARSLVTRRGKTTRLFSLTRGTT